MQQDYSIKKLVETFEEHSKISMQHQEFANKQFLEQFPDQPLPAHMENPFDAAKAFSVMAKEICEIKEHLQLK